MILLTDLNSRIPVAIEPGHIQAILTGDNSTTPSLELSKQGIALKEGEQIVTSGDGGLLPSGLAVGVVVWNGSEFRASLLADAATADDVRVLDLRSPPETPPAPTADTLPVSAAGLPPLAPASNTSPNIQDVPPVSAPTVATIRPLPRPSPDGPAAASPTTIARGAGHNASPPVIIVPTGAQPGSTDDQDR